MVAKNSHKWVDQLQNVTDSYNKSFHRSINMAPIDVTKEDSNKLWMLQYEKNKKPKIKLESKPKHPPKPKNPFKFKLNDHVRLSDIKIPFKKEYDETWTREDYIIADRFMSEGIPIYRLKDTKNEELLGTYQEQEMQKVYINADAIYRIESILKTKGKGKDKMHLVKWLGFDKKHASWVRDSEIINFETQ